MFAISVVRPPTISVPVPDDVAPSLHTTEKAIVELEPMHGFGGYANRTEPLNDIDPLEGAAMGVGRSTAPDAVSATSPRTLAG